LDGLEARRVILPFNECLVTNSIALCFSADWSYLAPDQPTSPNHLEEPAERAGDGLFRQQKSSENSPYQVDLLMSSDPQMISMNKLEIAL
jgi:hypothetical protein